MACWGVKRTVRHLIVDYHGGVWIIRDRACQSSWRGGGHKPPVSGIMKRDRKSKADLVESMTTRVLVDSCQDPWRPALRGSCCFCRKNRPIGQRDLDLTTCLPVKAQVFQ